MLHCKLAGLLCLGALLCISCCRYSFKGSTLPPGVRTVSLPLFINQTLEAGLEDEVRQSLQQAIITDNTLKLVENESDAELAVEISQYGNRPKDYDQAGSVKTYQVIIGVKVLFRNLKEDQVIYQGNLSGTGTYDHQLETEDAGKERALKQLNEAILNNTLSGW